MFTAIELVNSKGIKKTDVSNRYLKVDQFPETSESGEGRGAYCKDGQVKSIFTFRADGSASHSDKRPCRISVRREGGSIESITWSYPDTYPQFRMVFVARGTPGEAASLESSLRRMESKLSGEVAVDTLPGDTPCSTSTCAEPSTSAPTNSPRGDHDSSGISRFSEVVPHLESIDTDDALRLDPRSDGDALRELPEIRKMREEISTMQSTSRSKGSAKRKSKTIKAVAGALGEPEPPLIPKLRAVISTVLSSSKGSVKVRSKTTKKRKGKKRGKLPRGKTEKKSKKKPKMTGKIVRRKRRK